MSVPSKFAVEAASYLRVYLGQAAWQHEIIAKNVQIAIDAALNAKASLDATSLVEANKWLAIKTKELEEKDNRIAELEAELEKKEKRASEFYDGWNKTAGRAAELEAIRAKLEQRAYVAEQELSIANTSYAALMEACGGYRGIEAKGEQLQTQLLTIGVLGARIDAMAKILDSIHHQVHSYTNKCWDDCPRCAADKLKEGQCS